jgi:hypothetical protein
MRKRYYLSLLLILFLLPACSGQVSQESLATQQSASHPEAVSLPSLNIVDIIPTHTHTPIRTITPQIQSTQNSNSVDLDNLPKLSQVVLSSSDIKNLDEHDSNPLVLAIDDVTNELQNSCLGDCAKYRYSLDQGILTIVLLRGGDPQKAQSTVQNLRNDFLLTTTAGGYEYTVDDISNIPPEAWVIVDSPSNTKDSRTSAAGKSYGNIVVLVTYSQSLCENVPGGGRYCEGDMMGLALSSLEYLMAQLQKLEAAGYPK